MPPAEEGRVRRREETLRRLYNRHAGLPGGDRTDHPGGAGHVSTAQALQVPVTVLFSLCVDGALALIPSQYGGPWAASAVYLAAGCIVMSLGIYLEVLADVIMLPGEAFVRALSRRTGRGFGNIKVCFDSLLTIIAALTALCAFGRLNGVGGGTVFSALAVGQLVKGWGWLHQRIQRSK